MHLKTDSGELPGGCPPGSFGNHDAHRHAHARLKKRNHRRNRVGDPHGTGAFGRHVTGEHQRVPLPPEIHTQRRGGYIEVAVKIEEWFLSSSEKQMNEKEEWLQNKGVRNTPLSCREATATKHPSAPANCRSV